MTIDTSDPLLAASQWYARLASDEATAEDVTAWQQWKESDKEHGLAWERVEALTQRFAQLPPKIGFETFAQPTAAGRRRALKQLALLLGVGTSALLAHQYKPWQEALADYSTAVGETREIMLPDGTRMFLNTATAINVAYTDRARLIELIKGEVLIETAHEKSVIYRPFVLTTSYGSVTALGTRFSVRDCEQRSKVSVYEGAVRIMPLHGGKDIIIKAGQSVDFTDRAFAPIVEAELLNSAWTKGLLVVYSMPLGEFVEELARYRRGILRCDPAIQSLLVSGSFFIGDTDAVLNNLAHILPVRIESRTRYWISIQPA